MIPKSIQDLTHLKYYKPWSPSFPYCNRCGIISSNRGGICSGCLDGCPWDLGRTLWLTDVITEGWEFIDSDLSL